MKIKAPLQSEAASGMIGPRITFSKRKSGQQARFQKGQKDARSASQISQREKFENASFSCRYREYGVAFFGITLFGLDENFYIEEAKGKPMSEYNFCISKALENY